MIITMMPNSWCEFSQVSVVGGAGAAVAGLGTCSTPIDFVRFVVNLCHFDWTPLMLKKMWCTVYWPADSIHLIGIPPVPVAFVPFYSRIYVCKIHLCNNGNCDRFRTIVNVHGQEQSTSLWVSLTAINTFAYNVTIIDDRNSINTHTILSLRLFLL